MRRLPREIELVLEALEGLELEDYLLLAAVVLLPWAFGGVEIWAYRGASFLLASAAVVALWKHGWAGLGLDRRARWLLPAFLLVLWGTIQIVPLPPAVIGIVSPEANRVYEASLPGYPGPLPDDLLAAVRDKTLDRVPEAREIPPPDDPVAPDGLTYNGPRPHWRTLSLQPSATQERLYWYIALLLGFLVARTRTRDEWVFRVYRTVFFGLFVALALQGLLQIQTWSGKILWIRPLLYEARVFGPYINPTHFAGVMELAVPWLAAYSWSRYRLLGRDALREPRFSLALGGMIVCLMAGLAAASKMAALSYVVTLVLLGMVGSRSWRNRLAVLGIAVVLVGAGAALMTRTTLGERVNSYVERSDGEVVEEGRLVAWPAIAEIVADFPVTGAGFGTFRELFPRYMPAGEVAQWRQAHNDYLELLHDGGAIAGLLVLWLMWGFWSRALRRTDRRARGRALPELGLLLGLLALSIHAFVDFNHQIPANALMFVVASALALNRQSQVREIA